MNFDGKTVVVTGASSGIGLRIALDFAKKNSNVVLIARNKERLKKVLDKVKKYNKNCSAVICDVSDGKKVGEAIKQILEKYNNIDILINNAGFGIYKSFEDSSYNDFINQIKTNYFGVVYFCKEALPYLKQSKGHIVNIGSVAGLSGFPNISGYNASKFALTGFSESIYYEFKDFDVKVHLICPGAVDTNFYNNSWDKFPSELRHKNILSTIDVSKAVFDTIIKNKFLVVLPKRNKWIIKLKNLLLPLYMGRVSKLKR